MTDHSLRLLAKRTALTDLSLTSCPNVSDDGVRLLGCLSGLQRANVDGCLRVSAGALGDLQTALPNCSVNRR